jgi:3-deoxy-D-manno-octulosonic-acid transferase
VLTFFSPSGFERFKNFPQADLVSYLPIDSLKNANRFIEILNPSMALFVKYEFWLHYFETLHRRQIPFYLISAVFHSKQPFFKWWGSAFAKVLQYPKFFFLQDTSSEIWLMKLGLTNCMVAGDTRIDRVGQLAREAPDLQWLENFKGNDFLLIAGSTWPAEDLILLQWLKSSKAAQMKLVIAPHELDANYLNKLTMEFSAHRYSEGTSVQELRNAKVLLLDTIGLLNQTYRYADVAFIGGGFSDGIHSILEPAAFGVPVIFGPRHDKFWEAKALITSGAAKEISNFDEFAEYIQKWIEQPAECVQAGRRAATFIEQNQGATRVIFEKIKSDFLESN